MNCCPELDGMPKLGLGLAGLDDHEADPDGVVLGAVTGPREPPPPRSSFMSYLLFLFTQDKCSGKFLAGIVNCQNVLR